jgi:DNA polymerase V
METHDISSARAIKIISIFPSDQSSKCILPFAQELISAGFPSSAENFIQQPLDLNDLVIKHATATFFVKVIGDSMIDAGIRSNDILIVDRSLTPTNNKVVVVRINDEFTVKRIHFTADKIMLLADNQNYKPIEITKSTDFEIWGVVTFVIHQL